MSGRVQRLLGCGVLGLLAGCQAGPAPGPADLAEALGGLPAPVVVRETRQQSDLSRERVAEILASPLEQNAAVALALFNSRALQAMLAEGQANIAEAQQSGRLPNPVFSYERLRSVDEREIGRALTFGLLDLLTWPQRRAAANALTEAARWQLALQVLADVTRIRTAWVNAVAAEQRLGYAEQVLQSAEASAELARRMEAVGNFTRLARARQQLFESQARAELAVAQQERLSAREILVRRLGLDDAEAEALRLPAALPRLPAQLMAPEELRQRALSERLDVALAEARFQAAARSEGLVRVTSLGDLEGSILRERATESDGHVERTRGFELEVVLPLFDAGELRRGAASRRALAAANELEATLRAAGSHLRESFAQYRNSYEVASIYQNQVIPLRRQVSEETLLRYNAMLLGVFDLLADAREQRETVMQAIRAEEQFWLAEAGLQSALLGGPAEGGTIGVAGSAKASAEPGH